MGYLDTLTSLTYWDIYIQSTFVACMRIQFSATPICQSHSISLSTAVSNITGACARLGLLLPTTTWYNHPQEHALKEKTFIHIV
jgi:hypothetical protein